MTPQPSSLALSPHWHSVVPTRISDGDTIRVTAWLGLGLEMHHQPVRLLGIQAPELRGPDKFAGQTARKALSDMVLSRPCWLHCPDDERDRYGRWLGWLWHSDGGDLLCVNTHLVRQGWAYQWAPRRHKHGSDLPPERVRHPDRPLHADG